MTGTPVRGAGRLVCARSVSRAASPTTGPHRRRAQGGTWLAPPALTAGSASEGLGQPRARHARRWSCSPQCQAEPGLPSIKPPPLRSLQEHRVAASALFPQPGAHGQDLWTPWALGRVLGGRQSGGLGRPAGRGRLSPCSLCVSTWPAPAHLGPERPGACIRRSASRTAPSCSGPRPSWIRRSDFPAKNNIRGKCGEQGQLQALPGSLPRPPGLPRKENHLVPWTGGQRPVEALRPL